MDKKKFRRQVRLILIIPVLTLVLVVILLTHGATRETMRYVQLGGMSLTAITVFLWMQFVVKPAVRRAQAERAKTLQATPTIERGSRREG